MTVFARAAVLAAGFAVAFAAVPPVLAADQLHNLAPSLLSFGDAKAISAYELSAPIVSAALTDGDALRADNAMFAASTALTPSIALDTGRDLDIASRFTNYNSAASPFLSAVSAPYLGLANGGRYSGITFVPVSNLRLRLGASLNSERLDRFHFDAAAPTGPLALSYDASQTKSLLGALSWDVSSAIGLDLTAISSERSGVPLGFADAGRVTPKTSTNALGIATHVDIGQGWVTTASFSEGMTQLDQRGGADSSALHEQSYSIAIAKHGLFGDDTLGLSLSRPALSLAGSFSSLIGSGDLPPMIVTQGQALNTGRAPETDFQLGYVTNFLGGALALQTNAAYQTNAQGQPGATSVSLLSRAKIKF